MRLLIDIGAIKTGGGAQLALNFLDMLGENQQHKQIILLTPETGPLSEYYFDREKYCLYRYPNNYLGRFWFELTQLKAIYKKHGISHIFTFFGAGLPHPKHIKSVVTTAYPIICYPDSKFWQFAHIKTRLKNRVNNMLRRQRLRQASIIIVETDVMGSRIARHVPFSAKKITVLPPVPSRYINPVNPGDRSEKITFLLVSGCEAHKNLWRLPEIAQALIDQGTTDFQFMITVDKSQFIHQHRLPMGIWQQVERHFTFLGKIHPREIQSAYKSAHYLVNLSDLESFSNNYMEAWKAKIPLIASDRDFARQICGDSAVYIEPHLPVESARAILQLVADQHKAESLLDLGHQKLLGLGDACQRFSQVMDILRSA